METHGNLPPIHQQCADWCLLGHILIKKFKYSVEISEQCLLFLITQLQIRHPRNDGSVSMSSTESAETLLSILSQFACGVMKTISNIEILRTNDKYISVGSTALRTSTEWTIVCRCDGAALYINWNMVSPALMLYATCRTMHRYYCQIFQKNWREKK